jgi:diphosphomevalonate decarboxylase
MTVPASTPKPRARAVARAYANIALAKYWGKLEGPGNLPAVPSVSVSLEALATETSVQLEPALGSDELVLGGERVRGDELQRTAQLLERARAATGCAIFARVESRNSFPTGSGLASSASGFAALALAARAAYGLPLERSEASDLARRASASAARSLWGGFVQLAAGEPGQASLSARPIAPAEHWDLRVIVAVTSEAKKAVGSTEGMRRTAASSPYYRGWLELSRVLAARVTDAILSRDLEALGEAAEQSALAMHACAMAGSPPLLYLEPATLACVHAVRALRADHRRGPARQGHHPARARRTRGRAHGRAARGASRAQVACGPRSDGGGNRSMKVRAPGKVVLSGAYAVLERAPAIVAAVDRYVLADTNRPALRVSPEVQCAIGDRAPYIDTSSLRVGDRKLGLGSSAASVVAALAALTLAEHPELEDALVAERILPVAIRAHREAQGGGSGIDVATCALGGTRVCWLDDSGKVLSRSIELPAGVHIEVYASSTAASTAEMLARVRVFAKSNPTGYTDLIATLTDAARRAVNATRPAALQEALRDQVVGLSSLGDWSSAPIVPAWLRELAGGAHADGVVVMPSGAGGGDVVLSVGDRQACEAWRPRMEQAGLLRLQLQSGVKGVHRVTEEL